MHGRHARLAIAPLALVVAMTSAAGAQEQTGATQGTVRDQSRAVLASASVDVQSDAVVGGRLATVADTRGTYRFPTLPPGRYTVTAHAPGFSDGSVGGVVVALGQVLTVDLALRLAPLAESVTAVAESPLVDTTQTAAFATVPREVIDHIAAGRDFSSLIGFAPGARSEPKAGGQARTWVC